MDTLTMRDAAGAVRDAVRVAERAADLTADLTTGALARGRAALERRRARRRVAEELGQLGDRDLRDLGLRRADIPRVAAGATDGGW